MTLFEKILARKIPAKIVHEDEHCFAIEDINPQAPGHLLVIPRKVIPKLSDATAEDAEVLGRCMLAAAKLAGGKDFRLVINNGDEAGQTVFHLHLHVLTGRKFGWPPG
ncbi:MAG: histidine triad nucleotide-binding protein [Myxococcota bacterium]